MVLPAMADSRLLVMLQQVLEEAGVPCAAPNSAILANAQHKARQAATSFRSSRPKGCMLSACRHLARPARHLPRPCALVTVSLASHRKSCLTPRQYLLCTAPRFAIRASAQHNAR